MLWGIKLLFPLLIILASCVQEEDPFRKSTVPIVGAASNFQTIEDSQGLSITTGGIINSEESLTEAEKQNFNQWMERNQILITVGPKNGKLVDCETNSESKALNCQYIPNANFFGEEIFKYKAINGRLESAEQTILITVTSVTDNPVANNQDAPFIDEFRRAEQAPQSYINNPAVFDLNIIDYDNQFSELGLPQITRAPSSGSVECNKQNQKISCRFTPSFNFVGTDYFEYRVSKNIEGQTYQSNIARVNLQVDPVQFPPLLNGSFTPFQTSEPQTIAQRSTVAIKFNSSNLKNAFDYDPNDTKFHYEIRRRPVHGELVNCFNESLQCGSIPNIKASCLNNNLVCEYRPNLREYYTTTNDSFTYVATDGLFYSNEITVPIQIQPVNDAPEAVDFAVSLANNQVVNFTIPNAKDNDHQPFQLNYAINHAGISNCTKTSTGYRCQFLPNESYFNTNGNLLVNYTVTDPAGATDTGTVTFTKSFAPELLDKTFETEESFVQRTLSFTYTDASDKEGDAFEFLNLGQTEGFNIGSISNLRTVNGNLEFDVLVLARKVGDIKFRIQARETSSVGKLSSAPATITIRVNNKEFKPEICQVKNQQGYCERSVNITENQQTSLESYIPIAFDADHFDDSPKDQNLTYERVTNIQGCGVINSSNWQLSTNTGKRNDFNFTWTSDVGANGVGAHLCFRVKDSTNRVSDDYFKLSISINEINDRPVAPDNQNFNLQEGVEYIEFNTSQTALVLEPGTDPDNDPLTHLITNSISSQNGYFKNFNGLNLGNNIASCFTNGCRFYPGQNFLPGATAVFNVQVSDNKCGTTCPMFNITINYIANPIAKLKPALVVRDNSCLHCHAQIDGNYITDFAIDNFNQGAKFAHLGSRPGGLGGDHHTGAYQWGHKIKLPTTVINGTVIVPPRSMGSELSFNNAIKNIFQEARSIPFGQLNCASGNTCDAVFPDKTFAQPIHTSNFPYNTSTATVGSNDINTIAKYIDASLNYRSVDYLELIQHPKPSANEVGFGPKTLRTLVNNQPIKTPIREVKEFKLSIPNRFDIQNAFNNPTGNFKYVKTGALEFSGLQYQNGIWSNLDSNQNTANITCDGDVFLKGTLLLRNINLETNSGCRLYVVGTVFIDSIERSQGINFLSSSEDRNLQILSNKAVLLGLGMITNADNDTFNGRAVDNNPRVVPNLTNNSDGIKSSKQEYLDLQAAFGEDVLRDSSARPAPGRNVTFSRLLLLAPQVHSRYSGDFNGVIMTEFLLGALGNFKYKYHEVFSDISLLPAIDLSQFIEVEDCEDGQLKSIHSNIKSCN